MLQAFIRFFLYFATWVGTFDGRRGYPSESQFVEVPLWAQSPSRHR